MLSIIYMRTTVRERLYKGWWQWQWRKTKTKTTTFVLGRYFLVTTNVNVIKCYLHQDH